MAQALSNYISKEYQLKLELGAAVGGSFAIGDVIADNAVLGSATFFAVVKAVEGAGAALFLTCDSFGEVTANSVVYQSTAIVADAGTVYAFDASTGAATGVSAVVDTVTDPVNGADIVLTTRGIERIRTTVGTNLTRTTKEVLVAIRDFTTKQAV